MSVSHQIFSRNPGAFYLWVSWVICQTFFSCLRILSAHVKQRLGEVSGGSECEIQSPHLAATQRWQFSLVLLIPFISVLGDRALFEVFNSPILCLHVFSRRSAQQSESAAVLESSVLIRSSHGSSLSHPLYGVEGQIPIPISPHPV